MFGRARTDLGRVVGRDLISAVRAGQAARPRPAEARASVRALHPLLTHPLSLSHTHTPSFSLERVYQPCTLPPAPVFHCCLS